MMAYELPPVEDILAGLRKAGGKFRKYLRQTFDKGDRDSAMLDILELIQNSDDEIKQKFEDLRQLSKEASLIEAEDNLTSMVKAGKANSMRAIQTSLQHLSKVRDTSKASNQGLDDKLAEWE